MAHYSFRAGNDLCNMHAANHLGHVAVISFTTAHSWRDTRDKKPLVEAAAVAHEVAAQLRMIADKLGNTGYQTGYRRAANVVELEGLRLKLSPLRAKPLRWALSATYRRESARHRKLLALIGQTAEINPTLPLIELQEGALSASRYIGVLNAQLSPILPLYNQMAYQQAIVISTGSI